MYHQEEMSKPPKIAKHVLDSPYMENEHVFSDALRKIATAGAASSRAAIEAAKATKPSRHTRFVYDPAKGQV